MITRRMNNQVETKTSNNLRSPRGNLVCIWELLGAFATRLIYQLRRNSNKSVKKVTKYKNTNIN